MANIFSLSSFIFTFLLTIVFYKPNYVKSCSMKQVGENAARELGGSVEKVSDNLRNSLKETSDKLSRSIDKGIETTAATVKELAGSVEEIAKSVSVRIDSGDFSHIGQSATKNIRDALVELSKNWNLAVKTADLKDVGAEAAKYLSEAIQNVNIRINVNIGIDDNVLAGIGYISIAAGIAFSVCFIAIVISLKQCRSCTSCLIMGCVDGCRVSRNSNNQNQIQLSALAKEPDTKLKKKNNVATPNNQNINGKNRQSITLKDYQDFKRLQGFWEENEAIKSQQ